MTVIAWDGKSIAADRQGTQGDRRRQVDKLFQLADGTCLATIGDHEAGLQLMTWYREGMDPARWPVTQRDEDFVTLIVMPPDAKVYFFQARPIAQHVLEPFFAWGAGGDLALGAMAMGANATQAVQVATQFNIFCGLGITSFNSGGYVG